METQKHDRIVSLLKQEIKDLEAAAEEWKKMHDKRLDPKKVVDAINKIFSADSKLISNWKKLNYSGGFIVTTLKKELGLE